MKRKLVKAHESSEINFAKAGPQEEKLQLFLAGGTKASAKTEADEKVEAEGL